MHEARPPAENIFHFHSSVWKSGVDSQLGEGEGWIPVREMTCRIEERG